MIARLKCISVAVASSVSGLQGLNGRLQGYEAKRTAIGRTVPDCRDAGRCRDTERPVENKVYRVEGGRGIEDMRSHVPRSRKGKKFRLGL